MPIILCPKCAGKLRFPDDSPPRRVKCPTCGNVFQANVSPPPAEKPATTRPPRDDDRDRRSRRRDDDDDYDDRPRSRRDEDDDRDRRRNRDDDDDEDRGRRRYRDDDDDDDRGRRRRDERDRYNSRRRSGSVRAIEGQFNRASLACLLCFIGGWLQVGALGILLLAAILQWAEIREGLNVFTIIAGLLGLCSLLCCATGFGFLVSGPRDRGALGLSIGTAAVAAFHLILILVIATTSQPTVRDEFYSGVNWKSFVSELPSIPHLLFFLIGAPNVNIAVGRVILPIFASITEVAKIIMFLLTLRAIMRVARDSQRAKHCMNALAGNAIGVGALIVVGILFGAILAAVRTEKGAVQTVYGLFNLVVILIIAALAVWTTMVTKAVKEGIDYRRD